jgi:hypothetical protein
MKAVTVKQLKKELTNKSPSEVVELCLHLSKFKRENKELLTYLLFESSDEQEYLNGIKEDINQQFGKINKATNYLTKKGVRKILRETKKYIRYSKNKETEVELLLYFCKKLMHFIATVKNNSVLINIHNREIESIKKKVTTLHEDLQYDYESQLETIDVS